MGSNSCDSKNSYLHCFYADVFLHKLYLLNCLNIY